MQGHLTWTNHELRLSMGIPYPDDFGVATDEQVATVLLPCSNHARPTPHAQYLVEATERADHLHGSCADSRVIISEKADNSISRSCQDHAAYILVDKMKRCNAGTTRIAIVELCQASSGCPIIDTATAFRLSFRSSMDRQNTYVIVSCSSVTTR